MEYPNQSLSRTILNSAARPTQPAHDAGDMSWITYCRAIIAPYRGIYRIMAMLQLRELMMAQAHTMRMISRFTEDPEYGIVAQRSRVSSARRLNHMAVRMRREMRRQLLSEAAHDGQA